MELDQAIELIKHESISNTAQTLWADLGCGSGLFTNALAHLLAPGSKIYAVDKNINSFKAGKLISNVILEKIQADFIKAELNFSNLNGIVMANSLHFVPEKISFITKARNYLKANGCFLIVEYDMDIPNPWVPFPLSYPSLRGLFEKMGYNSIHKIHEIPSRYNRANIYSVMVKTNK